MGERGVAASEVVWCYRKGWKERRCYYAKLDATGSGEAVELSAVAGVAETAKAGSSMEVSRTLGPSVVVAGVDVEVGVVGVKK